MPLPDSFSEWEHLQDTVRLWHNKAVNQYFRNTTANSLDTPKESLRVACTMKDNDTSTMTMMRMWLFEVTAGRLQSVQAPIYGIPVQELQRESKFRPQIKLYFKEPYDIQKHGSGTLQHRAEIGFRVMNKTSDTITRADAVEYAREIKAEFITNPLVWKKGKYKCTYLDIENGFDLRLLCVSKSEGISTVQSVLKIVDKTYSDNNFQFIENTKEFPTNPGTHRVYGKTISKPRQRPTVDVKLTHAQLLIHGQLKPVNLVSVGQRLRSAIQYA